MSSIGDNIDALIENIKVSEHYAESQRNELHSVETEISKIKTEMLTMSLEKEDLKKDLQELLTKVNKQDATLMSLEKEAKIVRDVYKELKDLYDKESGILVNGDGFKFFAAADLFILSQLCFVIIGTFFLDGNFWQSEKQQEVWKNRELFCNNLRQFAEDWGPLSTSVANKNIKTSLKKETPSVSQSEELLGSDLKNLEKSIEVAKKKLAKAEENLKNEKSLKEKLSDEPEYGEEFVSLQAFLRQAEMETETLEKQCEEAKKDHWNKCKSKDSRQLTFLPEPPLTHPAKKPASYHVACSRERNHPSLTDENFSRKNPVNGSNTIKKFGMKRPVAAIAPAIENYLQGKEDDQKVASDAKKTCSFIPKKPSSLSKKFFTHSNGWVQLEKELSDLLRNDLPKS